MIEKVLSEKQIRERILELGSEISKDFSGKNMIIVSVLKGAFVFTSDLIRSISIPFKLDFVQLFSYGASKTSSGKVEMKKDTGIDIAGKNVLIVEDIIDVGYTLDFLLTHLREKNPASVDVCVLLDKVERRKIEVPVRYRGFEVPDKFLVGYGLDFDEDFRGLPYIGEIKEKA